jgi:hypothetical protein
MGLNCINGEWLPVAQGIKLIPDCERNNLSRPLFAFELD